MPVKRGIRRQPPTTLILDRYIAIKKIGQGGGGEVFLAKDITQGEALVALKRVALGSRGESNLAQNLENEFATLSRLNHPNLAKVLNYGVTDTEAYLTSELIEGMDFLCFSEKLELNTLFRLLVELLRALDYLHRRGVLHLDLKPGNILIASPTTRRKPTVKLIDFGIAQLRETSGNMKEFSGTPPFSPPEIITGGNPTPSSDLYSLGILLCLLFTGKFPFREKKPLKMIEELLYQGPKLQADLNPALPESMRDLLSKAIAKDPKNRFQSASEFLAGFNQVLGENFSLRSLRAPVNILAESDFDFFPETIEILLNWLKETGPSQKVLCGEKGGGKSQILQRVKAIAQLQGIPIMLWDNSEKFFEWYKNKSKASPSLLLDFPLNLAAQRIIAGYSHPVLWVSEPRQPMSLSSQQIIDLPILSKESLTNFLQHEWVEAPCEEISIHLQAMNPGNLHRLEEHLQGLREMGAFFWTSMGWHWNNTCVIDWQVLPSFHEKFWQEIWIRLEGILKASPIPLDQIMLEGLLGWESGGLTGALQRWVNEGLLQIFETSHGIGYSLSEKKALINDKQISPTDNIVAELIRLYQQDKFSLGAQWADALLSDKNVGQSLSPQFFLWSCRHWAAIGDGKKVERFLPMLSTLPQDAHGLFHETRARMLLLQGNYPEVKTEIELAEQAFKIQKDIEGEIRVKNLSALYYKGQKEFSTAEKEFELGIERATKASIPFLAFILRLNLGVMWMDQGIYDRALKILSGVLPQIGSTKHPAFEAMALSNWANLLYLLGRLQEAEKAAYQLLEHALLHGFIKHQAMAFNYLALIAGFQNNLAKQKIYLDQAIALMEKTPIGTLYPQLLINRSYLQLDFKNFTAAQIDIENALEILGTSPQDYLKTLSYLVLGRVYRDRPRSDIEKAKAQFRQALKLCENNQIRQVSFRILFELGVCEQNSSHPLEAKRYLEASRDQLYQFLETLSGDQKSSFLRDRKLEMILKKLKQISITEGRHDH